MDQLNELRTRRSLNRRSFLATLGAAGAATAMAGCGTNNTQISPTTPTTTTYTDVDILNFALNLEYLEAEFYLRAATGAGLGATDTGSSSATVTVPSTTKVTAPTTFTQNLLNELAYTEQQHVRFLRSALGSAAVARPAIDFVNSFNAIAVLAGLGSSFNPFGSFDAFITAAAVFEDVGVTAYNGAAPLISPAGVKSGLLAAAAGIMSVEAYHGATLRAYLTNQALVQGTTAYPYYGYLNSIQTKVVSVLSSGYGTVNLSGAAATPTTSVAATISASAVVPADSSALAFHRSTDQVLHIVYGSLSNTSGATASAAGVKAGGFFPNGVNGNIAATQS